MWICVLGVFAAIGLMCVSAFFLSVGNFVAAAIMLIVATSFGFVAVELGEQLVEGNWLPMNSITAITRKLTTWQTGAVLGVLLFCCGLAWK